ncbi:magnesium transporter MgtE N-terminal domain-containing protein [Humidisolicoccus flavus]|uniref:magnesium transporter MgtE N-terminal domain-containing protein n=1 Tax=Humidisolicoccus flavus TaxID=3111414 RepID=UPI0032456C47
MSSAKVFVARLAGCAVFDPAGDKVGKVRDVVVVPRANEHPRTVGMVVEVTGKRRVFLSIGRVVSIGGHQIITTGLINLRRFEQRGGEQLLLAEVIGRKVKLRDGSNATIEDLSMIESQPGHWAIDELFLRKPKTGPFGKGATTFAKWSEVTHDTAGDHSAEHLLASYSELPAADVANALLDLPSERRIDVANELSDDRLADVLEEMSESDQVSILNRLGDDRAADVLDQMQPDDAADLIAQLPIARGETLLGLMEPEEAQDVRMLLAYAPDTAGGLMTTEPIVLSPESTVAEALAMVRKHEVAPALAAAVCVTLPPYESPTGRFLGLVHFQRLLRYPPNERLGTLLDPAIEPVNARDSAAKVTRILATYDLVQLAVIDDAHRLVGVVTIDDVLDHILPDDWRNNDEDLDEGLQQEVGQ